VWASLFAASSFLCRPMAFTCKDMAMGFRRLRYCLVVTVPWHKPSGIFLWGE
jgi:hypothetical protein